MDGASDSSIWQRIAGIFHSSRNSAEAVEQAIIEAEEDGDLLADEKSMLLRVLCLDELTVQDIMTPRTDFACAPVDSDLAAVVQVIVESGHSRIPIFKDNRDNIVGIAYAKDMIKHWDDESMRHSPISKIMREPFFVPETKKVLDLLHEFRSRKNHLAVLLDEYGGTSGLVTVEDVIEEIIGEIEDEHDAPREEDIKVLDAKHIVVSGRAMLEDIEAEMGIKLESEDVDTIGGYLCQIAGRVPKVDDSFEIEGMLFTVLSADAKQVRSISVEPVASDSDAAEPEPTPS